MYSNYGKSSADCTFPLIHEAIVWQAILTLDVYIIYFIRISCRVSVGGGGLSPLKKFALPLGNLNLHILKVDAIAHNLSSPETFPMIDFAPPSPSPPIVFSKTNPALLKKAPMKT